MLRFLLAAGVGFCLSLPPQVWGEPDDAQQAWLNTVQPASFWDNLKGGDEWIQGPKPTLRQNDRRHYSVRLQPATSITLRLPAGEGLRLYAPDDHPPADDYEFSWSNGSRLFAELKAVVGNDGRSLLISPPAANGSLLRVERRAQSAGDQELILFASRNPNRLLATHYRTALKPADGRVAVVLMEPDRHETFWRITPDQPLSLPVHGPGRLRIESRLLLSTEDTATESYRLDALLDGEPWRSFDLATLLESGKPVRLDGCQRPIGRPAYAYLDLPEHGGTLELRARQPMLLQLKTQGDDYLYAHNREVSGLIQPDESASLLSRNATRLAQDNSRPLGGLAAQTTFEAIAERYPAQQEPKVRASRRRALHSNYRILLPEKGFNLRRVSFDTPRLALEDEEIHLYADQLQSLADDLPRGYFSEVPASRIQPLSYRLPQEMENGELRIAVDAHEGGLFYLQLDDRPPMRLRIVPDRPLPADAYRPSNAAIARALLDQQQTALKQHLMVDAAHIDLPLEGAVNQIRVWRETDHAEPMGLALAYRSSGWFQLSETGYLGLLGELGETGVEATMMSALNQLRHSASNPGPMEDLLSDPKTELINQWLPLLRWLRSRYTQLTRGISPTSPDEQPTDRLSRSRAHQIVREASSAEAHMEWQQALEAWTRLLHGSEGETALQARAGRIRALRGLGEDFLADQLLRQDLISDQPARWRQALQTLIEDARASDDPEAILSLRTLAAIRQPNADSLQALAPALAATGRDRFALQLLLALPANQRLPEVVLESAYALSWWQLFEQTLPLLSDPRRQALWRGYRAQDLRDHEQALHLWGDAGAAAEVQLQLLQRGLAIREDLTAEDPSLRRQALFAWEQWQSEIPGPRIWRDYPEGFTRHAGGRTLTSIAQGSLHDLMLSTPEQPTRIAVYGPARLRLNLRPLHDSKDDQPVNGWVRVSSQDRSEHYPLIDNKPSSGLRLAGDPQLQVGTALEVVQEIPAGYHEIEVDAADRDLLVGAALYEPRLPLDLLPRLTPYTAYQALSLESEQTSSHPVALPVQLIDECTANQIAVLPSTDFAPWRQPLVEDFQPLEAIRGEAPVSPLKVNLHTQLSRLLWEAERRPSRHLGLLAAAEHLTQGVALSAESAAVLRRLRQPTSWERVRNAQDSAGLRLIETRGWQPESPGIQARLSLLSPLRAGEQLLSGHDTRAFSLYNLEPVEIELYLELDEAARQPMHPMRVSMVWDDKTREMLTLSADRPRVRRTKRLAPGEHSLRLRITDPLANQVLRFRVVERTGATRQVIDEPGQRSYFISSRRQPLVLRLQGPTRLRIDEWRNGRTWVSYRNLPAGWQQVKIPPPAGREEALLRVFRLNLEPDKPVSALRQTDYRPQPLPDPAHPRAVDLGVADQPLRESYRSLLPDAGTWTLRSGLNSRRSLDDEPGADSGEELYLSLGGGYRRYLEQRESYYQLEGEMRLRERGNPSLALEGHFNLRKTHWPLDLDLSTQLYLQQVDESGGLEGAARFQGRISREWPLTDRVSHRPSLSLFQRWLSLDGDNLATLEEIDQDIYTEYKQDHQRGWRLAERLNFRPWLDNLIYTGAYMTSNDSLNPADPDHLGFKLGARQLLGDIALGVELDQIHYLEDDDRPQSADALRLRMDAEFARWLSPYRGLRANLSLRYDHDSGDASLFLTVALDQNNGRHYQDFRPGEIDFRPLRQRQALERLAEDEDR